MPTALEKAALDFAPGLLALRERPPERLPRAMALAVIALTLATIGWAALARRDVIAVAQGRLVPATYVKVLQPAESGVVSQVLVREGEAVHAGQLLIRMDSRSSQADLDALRQEVALRRITLTHINAELIQGAPHPVAGAPAGLSQQVQAQFQARRRSFDDALAQESQAWQRSRSDLLAARQILQKIERGLPSYRQAEAAYRKLVSEGFVSELAAVDRQRDLLEREQDLHAQAATVEGLNSTVSQLEGKIAALRSQYASQLQNERIETISQLNRVAQDLQKSELKAGLLELRAPAAGVVKDLTVTTPGAVVAAGASLLTLVPVGELLQAEVILNNEDVGFTSVGQAARIKVATYPFQHYGMLDGKVSLISADSIDPRQTPAGQPAALAYRAVVDLSTRALVNRATGERLQLTAGMLVVSEIHQGNRSVLEYLLSPVRKTAHEAGRER